VIASNNVKVIASNNAKFDGSRTCQARWPCLFDWFLRILQIPSHMSECKPLTVQDKQIAQQRINEVCFEENVCVHMSYALLPGKHCNSSIPWGSSRACIDEIDSEWFTLIVGRRFTKSVGRRFIGLVRRRRWHLRNFTGYRVITIHGNGKRHGDERKVIVVRFRRAIQWVGISVVGFHAFWDTLDVICDAESGRWRFVCSPRLASADRGL